MPRSDGVSHDLRRVELVVGVDGARVQLVVVVKVAVGVDVEDVAAEVVPVVGLVRADALEVAGVRVDAFLRRVSFYLMNCIHA